MLGNGYWKEQGVPVLAHVDAVYEIQNSGSASLARLKRVTREKAENSRVELPTETFSDKRIIELGDTRIEVLWLGYSHSVGDIVVWLPGEKLVISGDMAFHERILPIFETTDTHSVTRCWRSPRNPATSGQKRALFAFAPGRVPRDEHEL